MHERQAQCLPLLNPVPAATGAVCRTLGRTGNTSAAETRCFKATTASEREITNVPGPWDRNIRVLWTPPAACTPSVTHALCMPVSYSSLCSAQRPALSSLSWLLLPSHCCGDKKGWDGRGQIFFKAQQLPLHCCSWDKASPSRQHLGRSSTQLGLRCWITLHSKTDMSYYWIMTDFGFKSSVAPKHAGHLNSQLFTALDRETILC